MILSDGPEGMRFLKTWRVKKSIPKPEVFRWVPQGQSEWTQIDNKGNAAGIKAPRLAFRTRFRTQTAAVIIASKHLVLVVSVWWVLGWREEEGSERIPPQQTYFRENKSVITSSVPSDNSSSSSANLARTSNGRGSASRSAIVRSRGGIALSFFSFLRDSFSAAPVSPRRRGAYGGLGGRASKNELNDSARRCVCLSTKPRHIWRAPPVESAGWDVDCQYGRARRSQRCVCGSASLSLCHSPMTQGGRFLQPLGGDENAHIYFSMTFANFVIIKFRFDMKYVVVCYII